MFVQLRTGFAHEAMLDLAWDVYWTYAGPYLRGGLCEALEQARRMPFLPA
jgi:hypothetical protein